MFDGLDQKNIAVMSPLSLYNVYMYIALTMVDASFWITRFTAFGSTGISVIQSLTQTKHKLN